VTTDTATPRTPLHRARLKVGRLVERWLDQGTVDGPDQAMPMIPFVAKDRLSIEVLEFYLRRLRQTQDVRLGTGREKLLRPMAEGHDPIQAEVAALLADFYRWQSEHAAEVKWPD
jgi:hypothetical protein